MSTSFNKTRFLNQLETSIDVIRKLLDDTRMPQCAEDVEHSYDDKYGLAEFLTNVAVAAKLNSVERLGMDSLKLKKLKELSEKDPRAVTLRFSSKETCTFIEEKEVKIDQSRQIETSTSGPGARVTKSMAKVVTKVMKYYWKFELEYKIFAFVGDDPDSENKVILQDRTCHSKIVTSGEKKSPRPSISTPSPIDLTLTWLLKQIHLQEEDQDSDYVCNFKIDRSVETCRTPRRNKDIEKTEAFFNAIRTWCEKIHAYLVHELAGTVCEQKDLSHITKGMAPPEHQDLAAINTDGVFVPVLPLFQNQDVSDNAQVVPVESSKSSLQSTPMVTQIESVEKTSDSPILAKIDLNLLLKEQCRSLDEKSRVLMATFPSDDEYNIISFTEANIAMLSLHTKEISLHFGDGINYIENMLHQQLVAAIGKEIQPSDFEEFTRFHYNRFFAKNYCPQSFCYAIRRPGHYPDGTLSIEKESGGNRQKEPIVTVTRKLESASMYFPLNAATTVECKGEMFVHAWMLHDFSLRFPRQQKVDLIARTRQFSSFLLVIGKLSGPDSFQPQHAIILQNKDEILIPLLLEQLPTPKEFKDAIKSLSPEQRRFASAFREMQLESSVFAMCVIQLKPQLEALLGLPPNSLTKEIQLTQDLLSLFIEYQIPSDLLTYDGDLSVSSSERVKTVKKHVEAVQKIIAKAKENELAEESQKADMRFESFSGNGPQVQLQAGFAAPVKLNAFYSSEIIEQSSVFKKSCITANAPSPKYRTARELDISSQSLLPTKKSVGAQTCESQTIHSHEMDNAEGKGMENIGTIDCTLIPKQLDAKFETLDSDSALRATKIKLGETWTKKYQKSLLLKTQSMALSAEQQKGDKDRAFDLLDALSRSGSLPIANAELHVIVATTHCFDKSLMKTVVEDNINPIERIEKSMLIVASTIFGVPVTRLLKDEAVALRVANHSPLLLTNDDDS